MMKYFFTVAVVCVLNGLAAAQSYYKGLTATDRVTINYPEHTLVIYTKQVKQDFSPDPSKYYSWYASRQVHRTQGGFSGKLLNGLYTDYYLNKNLKEQGEFSKGLKTGEWKSWYEDGKLKEQINWKSGLENGRFYRYSAEGKPEQSGRYRSGLLSGKVSSFKGDSVEVSRYRKGKIYTPKKVKILSSMKKLYPFKKQAGKKKEKKQRVRRKREQASPGLSDRSL